MFNNLIVELSDATGSLNVFKFNLSVEKYHANLYTAVHSDFKFTKVLRMMYFVINESNPTLWQRHGNKFYMVQ